MKMDDVTSAADGLDPQNRAAIVKLIDLKVEDDMKEVLNAMHSEFKHIENKFSTVYWVIGLSIGLSTAFLAILMTVISLFKH